MSEEIEVLPEQTEPSRRNFKRNNAGGIDCELEHPQYGWIPYTLAPDEAVPEGEAIASADPVSDEQVAFAANTQRIAMLTESDWVTIRAMERGEPVPAEWAAYRQSLRDLSQHPNWPHLQPEDWPVAPGG